MKKIMWIFLGLLFGGLSAGAQESGILPAAPAVNSLITIQTLAKDTGAPVTITFLVTSVENGLVNASEIAPDGPSSGSTLSLQYKVGTEDITEILFKMKTPVPDSDQVQVGIFDKVSGIVTIHRCQEGSRWVEHDPQTPSMPPMCMPYGGPNDEAAAKKDEISPATKDHQCGKQEVWSNSCMTGMYMCCPDTSIPGVEAKKFQFHWHWNQFLFYTDQTGPRGGQSFSAPGMAMGEASYKTGKNNSDVVGGRFMVDPDALTVGSNGYHELLQVGDADKNGKPFIDRMHGHPPLSFEAFAQHVFKNGDSLEIAGGPRWETGAGAPFGWHRPSGEMFGNIELNHHLDNKFHVSNDAINLTARIKNTTIEASGFCSKENVPTDIAFKICGPNSYSFRFNQTVKKNYTVGGSYAHVAQSSEPGENPEISEDGRYFATWLMGTKSVKKNQVDFTSVVTYLKRNPQLTTLTSFLEEAATAFGKNGIAFRAEIVQRSAGQLSPDQYEVHFIDPVAGTHFVQAYTFVYERQLKTINRFQLSSNVGYTRNVIPTAFSEAYGGSQNGFIFGFRIKKN